MKLVQERLFQLIIGFGIILVLLGGIFFNGYSILAQDLVTLEHEINAVNTLRQIQQLSITLADIRGLEQINKVSDEKPRFNSRLDTLKHDIVQQIKSIRNHSDFNNQHYKQQLTALLTDVEKIATINKNSNQKLLVNKEINDFFITIGDQSKLLFDPDRTSYFLITLMVEQLPQLIDELSKVRTYGSTIIGKKQYTSDESNQLMHYQLSYLDKFEHINTTFELLLQQNPLSKILDIKNKVDQVYLASQFHAELLDEQIQKQAFSMTSVSFFNASSKLIKDTHSLSIDISLLLNEQFEKRKTELQSQQAFNLTLLLFVCVGLMIGGGYFYFLLTKRLFNQQLETQQKALNNNLVKQSTLFDVCETSLSFIANSFSILKGVLYLYNEQNGKLYLSSVYAENEKKLRQILPLGDGVIGQAAKDRKSRVQFFRQDVEGTDIGLIKTHSKNILTFPLCYQDQVEAVIQLATIKSLDQNEKKELEALLQLIARRIQQTRLIQERAQIAELVDKHIITSRTNEKGFITSVSQAFIDISGFSRDELIGKQHSIVRHPDMPKEGFKDLWKTIKRGQVWQGELKNRTKLGGFYWVDVVISPEHDFYGNIIGYTAIRQDITDKKRIEELSIKDPMTNLYNRRFFDDKFKELFRFIKREKRLLIFGILDVDFFKQYNDFYGHQKGDVALIAIAGVIKQAFGRPTDYCFRLGGEEFGILFLAENTDQALVHVNELRNQVENGLQIKHKLNKASEYITISVGLFEIDSKCELTEEQCYRLADQQLYKAKNDGRNNVKLSNCSDNLTQT